MMGFGDVPVEVLFIGVLFFAAVAAGGIAWYRGRTKKLLDAVLQTLDTAISGGVQEDTWDESMNGAIVERLNRLVQISKANRIQSEQERNLVKSLISDISHQVRTPLANIMLYAGLLQESLLEEGPLKMAEQIQRQSEKLDFFMKELMRSSYLETELITVDACHESVDDLIQRACQAIEMQALKKGILIRWKSSGESCLFDMKWSVEALVNLLDNGIKYSAENSGITIGVVSLESFVCIRVQDEGIGISEEEQGRIFQRFYRSPAAAGEPGLGIGLYLVREIIKKQGGYLKVQSQSGQGSVFSVYLPRREA